jgi:GxxExxY protein
MLIEAPFNETTGEIIAAAIEVHRALGPGLLESMYSECLQCELATRKLRYITQHPLPLVYKGKTLNTSYRVDLIVEDCVVVEVKSVAAILPVHRAQLLTDVPASHGMPGGTLDQLSGGKADGWSEACPQPTSIKLRASVAPW